MAMLCEARVAQDTDTGLRPVVLVVDDDEVSRLFAHDILAETYRVLVAEDGPQALETVRGHAADLVLLDIHMPGMSGFDVCRRLKADPATKAIPVIFLTAFGSSENEEAGLALGAVDYVNKATPPALLRARVSAHIALYRAQSAIARHARELERQVEEKTQELRLSHEAELGQAQKTVFLMAELEALISLAPVGIARVRQRRFVKVNDAFNRMLGYRGEDLLGQGTRVIYRSDEQYEALGRDAGETMRRRESLHFETELQTSTGGSLWVMAGISSASPLNDESDVLLIIQDISAHRTLEAQLALAAERARALSHAKSEFLSAIGHGLRTPLNGILGMAQLLLAETEDPQRGYARSIRESGENLLAILNRIIAFTSLDARPLADALEPANLFMLIALRADSYQGKAQMKGLAFSMAIGEALQVDCRVDARSIDALLAALLDNAVAFTDAGEIALAADLETERDGQASLACSIRDTGIGMKAETLDKLFTPFFQEKNPGRSHPGGLGLGLALARKLVDRLGGTLAVSSRPGQGSTVSFRLPVDAHTAADREPR